MCGCGCEVEARFLCSRAVTEATGKEMKRHIVRGFFGWSSALVRADV